MTRTAKIIQELEIRIEMLQNFIDEARKTEHYINSEAQIQNWIARRNELISVHSFVKYTLTEQEYTND